MFAMESWDAQIGKVLDCLREPSNVIDRYAVAVVRSEETVQLLQAIFHER